MVKQQSKKGRGLVLSLFDFSGIMVKPWREAGYETLNVDLKNGIDVLRWLPPRVDYHICFAFPPCTDQAVSGARWFKDKGLAGLARAIELVERARDVCAWCECPWMIENPVSVMSSYWRKPDYQFHPWQFAGHEPADNYTKKTCLWTGNGFVMPEYRPLLDSAKPDNRIHAMPPSKNRGDLRSVTPQGFARAVFEANA